MDGWMDGWMVVHGWDGGDGWDGIHAWIHTWIHGWIHACMDTCMVELYFLRILLIKDLTLVPVEPPRSAPSCFSMAFCSRMASATTCWLISRTRPPMIISSRIKWTLSA